MPEKWSVRPNQEGDIIHVQRECRTTGLSQEDFDEVVSIWKREYPDYVFTIRVEAGYVQCQFIAHDQAERPGKSERR